MVGCIILGCKYRSERKNDEISFHTPTMPYQSPNIVIIPTTSSINKKVDQDAQNTPNSDKACSTPISANLLEPKLNMPPKFSNTIQEAPILTNSGSDKTNKVSKENVNVENQGTIPIPEVSQSDSVKNISASSKDKKTVQKPSWASIYLQNIRQSTNIKPKEVNLLSTSNDVLKRTVKSKGENKSENKIKINLLSHSTVIKTTDTGPPLVQTPNFSPSVRPCMDTTLTYPSQLDTPTNQNIDVRRCMDTTLNYPSQLDTPTNQNIDVRRCMDTTLNYPSQLDTPTNQNIDVRRCMNTTLNYPSQLDTPTNQGIDLRRCMDTALTYPSQLNTPTNQSIDCRPLMDTTWTCPPLLQTPTHLSVDSRPCLNTTNTCSSQLHIPTNLSMEFRPPWTHPPIHAPLLQSAPNIGIVSTPNMNTAWTYPFQLQTPTNLNTDSMPGMDTTWTCPSQFQTPLNLMNDLRPSLDTNIAQDFCTNTIDQRHQNIHTYNTIESLDREKNTTYTKITPNDDFKSRMDYTWLTRAHYANIQQPNKNISEIKQVSRSKNTEKHIGRRPTNSLAKKSFIPNSGKDDKLPYHINKTKCKIYSDEELFNSETNAKKLHCIKKITGLNKRTKKEIREKEKSDIKRALKTIETKIKQLASDQKKTFKIPKLSDTKKKYVEPSKTTAEISSKPQHIENTVKAKNMISDKSKNEEKQSPKKRSSSPEQTYKERIRHNLESKGQSKPKIRKLPPSKRFEPDQASQNPRKSKTEISSNTNSKKNIHVYYNNQKDKSLDFIDGSERDTIHCSERLHTKRKRRDYSYKSKPKKRLRPELDNIDTNETISPIQSIVTLKKSVKHPRVQAPESDDSDDEFESDFDLRSKLSQVIYNRNIKYKMSHETQVPAQMETPRENLVITVNRNDEDITAASPKPGTSIPKPKSKKYKKIRLVINVIEEDTSEDSSSDVNKDTIVNPPPGETNESYAQKKLDLSFLDDFNIDEIVNSLKQNPILDNVQQNIKHQVENTKTLTESVTNKFVQPIIVKNEIKTEPVDPEIQPDVKYTPDIQSDAQPLKNNIYEETLENIIYDINETRNEVFTHNIKREQHEDQTEKLYINNSNNSTIQYLQTSLDEDVFQTVNQLIDLVVENTQDVINTISVVEIIRDIKREPCESYNYFDQDDETQDLFDAGNIYNLENADTQVSTELADKESESSECRNLWQFSASEKIFVESNQSKVQKIDEDVRGENNNKEIISSSSDYIKGINATETIHPEVEEKASETELTTNISAKCNVAIRGGDVEKIKSDACKSTNINDVNKTQTIQPEVKETTFEDKPATNTLVMSEITIEANYKIKINDKIIKTIDVNDANVTEPIQSEVELAIPAKVQNPKSPAKSDDAIKDNYEVKISSDVIKTVNLEDITKTTTQKAREDNTATNSLNLLNSDVTIEGKNKEIPNNESADTRIVTIMQPSLKSDKVLAIRIEERILSYLNLELNVISLIHRGKFAKVFQCKDKNGQNYAVKILQKENDRLRVGCLRDRMLNKLQNDVPKENLNIVYLRIGFVLDLKWCVLMDYYPMNLGNILGKSFINNMDTVQELAKQLVSAVLMMRSYNIVHSDIKPTHILLNENCSKLKVCGFDEAFCAGDYVRVLPNLGTVHYRAPEVILGYSAGFGIDVWATALVMYEMVVGTKLFDSQINYNSNVLFNQMSLCGEMPMDMVQNSRYSSYHFIGTAFKRVVGPYGQFVLYHMHKFSVKTNMYNILIGICNQKWPTSRSKSMQARDRIKLAQMCRLLDKMLVLDPYQRIPIEGVNADSFFM